MTTRKSLSEIEREREKKYTKRKKDTVRENLFREIKINKELDRLEPIRSGVYNISSLDQLTILAQTLTKRNFYCCPFSDRCLNSSNTDIFIRLLIQQQLDMKALA